jgi:TolB-like protein
LPNEHKLSIPEKSIAVLPFENLSSDKDNSYFAEGIQDESLKANLPLYESPNTQ